MPNPETVQKALRSIQREGDYKYFFDQLQSPEWIEPLWEAGLFKSPPAPVRDGPYVQFPLWPESRYLARMAVHEPTLVRRVILQIPETENIRVHEDLAEAALAMPPEDAAKIVPMADLWLRSPYQLALPEKLGALISHLARGNKLRAALRLARELLAVLPDPKPQEETALAPEPRARFEAYDYEQILKENVPALVEAAGEEGFSLLCDLLDKAMLFSQREKGDKPGPDYSYIWRPAIEDEREAERGLRGPLVAAVRDAAEQVAAKDPSRISSLVTHLDQRRWPIFQRIALHLLRGQAKHAMPLVLEWLTRKEFLGPHYRHEYILLLREHCDRLSQIQQTQILVWINEEETDKRPPIENLREWALHRADFVYRSSVSWVGPTSPKTVDELRALSIPNLVAYLRGWKPSKEWGSPSPDGLGRLLTEIVAANPEPYAKEALLFKDPDPSYISALLWGLEHAVKNQKSFPWPPVLELCDWVVRQRRDIPDRQAEEDEGMDAGWGWTRRTIAGLLEAGFVAEPPGIPFKLRETAWKVLIPLTDDPDPRLEDEKRDDDSFREPENVSINTVRGEAMHAVVRYALWVRKFLEKSPDAEKRLARGFDEMPEVREVLEAHLDSAKDPSPAIRSVYGRWFPWLSLIDGKWAASQVPRTFQRAPDQGLLRDAAWETYIVYCESYDPVFDILREEYATAIDRISKEAASRKELDSAETHLAEHLMAFYWRGLIPLGEEDGLLARFYTKAPEALACYALHHIGRSLENTKEEVPPKVLARIQALWEHRLKARHVGELIGFGRWFTCGKFDDRWSVDNLIAALEIAGEVDPDFKVAERLAQLAPAFPLEAVKALSLMIGGDKKGWGIHGWLKGAREILQTAINSSDAKAREMAIDLVHRLGALGHYGFRDLLS